MSERKYDHPIIKEAVLRAIEIDNATNVSEAAGDVPFHDPLKIRALYAIAERLEAAVEELGQIADHLDSVQHQMPTHHRGP